MGDDDSTLYNIRIQTWASPEEVHEFCDLLEAEGYKVVTDLKEGRLRVDDRPEEDDDRR